MIPYCEVESAQSTVIDSIDQFAQSTLEDSLAGFAKRPAFKKSPKVRSLATVNTTTIDAASSWLAKDLQKIAKLRTLPTEWESSGAAPPNERALSVARTILTNLANLDFKPDHIDPSTDEGVCISFRRNGKYADVECFNNGEILAVTSFDNGGNEIWSLRANELSDTLAKLCSFITD